MGPAPRLLPESAPLEQIREAITEQRVVLVVDQQGKLTGILTPADIRNRSHAADGRALTAGNLAVRNLILTKPGESTRTAVRRMVRMGLRQLPVVEDGVVVGPLRRSDILRAYEKTLDDALSPVDSSLTGELAP